jgi:hypothetical protein
MSELLKKLSEIYGNKTPNRDAFGRRQATRDDFGRTPATPAQIKAALEGGQDESDFPPTEADLEVKDEGYQQTANRRKGQ